MAKQRTILWATDSPFLMTGYSSISLNLLNRLADKGWDVHWLTHTFMGQKITQQPLSTWLDTLKPKVSTEDYTQLAATFSKYNLTVPGAYLWEGVPFNFTLHGQGTQPYCADLIVPKIKQLKPDFFGVLWDTFFLYPWAMNLDFSPAKSIFYYPSDGREFPQGCENLLRKFNIPVAMSKYGQRTIKEQFNIDAHYIPHACDPNHFYRLSNDERDALRVKYGLKGKFVVGVVARNQGRKMLDRTIIPFKFIAEKYPDAILLMHTDPDDLTQVFNLRSEIQKLGIGHRVFFTGMKYHEPFSYQQMNEIYNLMDVFMLGTSGEGFGVPLIEAMACEIPIVATDYTSTEELTMDGGVSGIPIALQTEILGNWAVYRGISDHDSAVENVSLLYEDENERRLMGKRGRLKVLREYNWDKVTNSWIKLLEENMK